MTLKYSQIFETEKNRVLDVGLDFSDLDVGLDFSDVA